MYDFHKTVQDPSHGEFQHQYFKQNRPDLLVYIKRKANNRNDSSKKFQGSGGNAGGKTSTAQPAASNQINQSSSLLSRESLQEMPEYDLDALDGLEESLGDYEDLHSSSFMQSRQISAQADFEKKMEAKLSRVEEENRLLKQMFVESHQKNLLMQDRMERVLKTLYSVFMAHPSAGKALASRMPSMMLGDISPFPAPPKGLLTDDNQGPLGVPLIDFPSESGLELTANTRGTSFDYAAASISAPVFPNQATENTSSTVPLLDGTELRYLPSFDSSLIANGCAAESSNINDSDQVMGLRSDMTVRSGGPLYRSQSLCGPLPNEEPLSGLTSDRVTLLPDSPKQDQRPASTVSADSMNNGSVFSHNDDNEVEKGIATVSEENTEGVLTSSEGQAWRSRLRAKRKANSSAEDLESTSKIAEGEKRVRADQDAAFSTNPYPAVEQNLQGARSASDVDLAQADTRHFLDVLHANQNTTLHRLDSLEQTIATLLDHMDYDESSLTATDCPATVSGPSGAS